MCKIVLSDVPVSPGDQGVWGEGSFHLLRISSQAEDSIRTPHRIGLRKQPKELIHIPIQAPEYLRGKWSKSCYKIKEVAEEKVMMIEDIHIEPWGCLYRWCRVGISTHRKINDPHSLLVHVQAGPIRDVFKVTKNHLQFSRAIS
jgi:hypothetical protein